MGAAWLAGVAVSAACLAAATGASAHGDRATQQRVLLEDGRVAVLHSDARDLGLTAEQNARSWTQQPRRQAVGRTGEAVVPAANWCGESRATDDVEHGRTTLPRYKVVYAHLAGQNQLKAPNVAFPNGPSIPRATVMQRVATWVAGKLAPRGVRFDYGTSCGPEHLDILTVQLPDPANAYNSSPAHRAALVRSHVLDAADQAGLDRGVWDFLVFADTGYQGGPGWPFAEAYLEHDPNPDPAANANTKPNHVALLYTGAFDGHYGIGYTAYVATHEIVHTLGAVVPGAPHRTPGAHCTDIYSVMCYDDDGAQGPVVVHEACDIGIDLDASGTPKTLAQFDAIPLDCNSDNYFNLDLGAFAFWNVNSHPAVCEAQQCLASTIEPIAAVTGSPGAATAGSPVRFDASSSSDRDGTFARFEWDLDGNGSIDETTSQPILDHVPRRSGSVGGGRVVVVDDDGLTDAAALPAFTVAGRAPVMTLAVPAPQLSGTALVLDASGSFDPDEGGRITSYRFELPDGTSSSGSIPQLTWTPQRPGSHQVRVTGTDDEGRTAETTATVTVLNRAPTIAATASPTRVALGTAVRLSARAADADGTVGGVMWDFDGDGTTDETGATVDLVLPDAGRRTIRATVSDDLGATATDSVAVEVVRSAGVGGAGSTRRSVLPSLRRSRSGTIVARVRCLRTRACRMRLTAGTVRRDVTVSAGRTRTVRLRLPARLRKRSVRFTLRDRVTGRRLALRTLAAPRR